MPLFYNRIKEQLLLFDSQKTEMVIFSAPEPKAQVHYCDHALSVVCPSVRR